MEFAFKISATTSLLTSILFTMPKRCFLPNFSTAPWTCWRIEANTSSWSSFKCSLQISGFWRNNPTRRRMSSTEDYNVLELVNSFLSFAKAVLSLFWTGICLTWSQPIELYKQTWKDRKVVQVRNKLLKKKLSYVMVLYYADTILHLGEFWTVLSINSCVPYQIILELIFGEYGRYAKSTRQSSTNVSTWKAWNKIFNCRYCTQEILY